MVSLYDYFDYRQFLRDFLEEKKKSNAFLSYRNASARIGIDPSTLLKILQHQLHLSQKRIPPVIQYCRFDEAEAKYFESLILFNKAKREETAKIYFEKLLALNNRNTIKLDNDQYQFFSHWYHTAVWCCLNIFRCKSNYKELGQTIQPKLTAAQTKSSIQLLHRLSLVKKDEDGYWVNTEENISTGSNWRSLAIRQYQKSMMNLGIQSLDNFPKRQRDVTTLTLNVDAKAFEELRVATEEYRNALRGISNLCESSDQVIQVNIQVFPIAGVGL